MEAEAKIRPRHSYSYTYCPRSAELLAAQRWHFGQLLKVNMRRRKEPVVSDERGDPSSASSIPAMKKEEKMWKRRDSDAGLQALQSISAHVRHIQYLMYIHIRAMAAAGQHLIPMCVTLGVSGRVAIYIYIYYVNGPKHFIHCQLQLSTGCSVIQRHNAKKGIYFSSFLLFLLFLC